MSKEEETEEAKNRRDNRECLSPTSTISQTETDQAVQSILPEIETPEEITLEEPSLVFERNWLQQEIRREEAKNLRSNGTETEKKETEKKETEGGG